MPTTTAAVAAATKPGAETSEQKLATLISNVAIVVTLLGSIAACLPASVGTNHYAAVLIAAIGAATKVLVALGYMKARTDLKTAVVAAVDAFAPAAAKAALDGAAALIPANVGAPAVPVAVPVPSPAP